VEKRIANLTYAPHAVSLTDRQCSLFIDPKTGSIFVDEGEGKDRMNGAVFFPSNHPSFSVHELAGLDSRLVLNYCGTMFLVGIFAETESLKAWASSANALLANRGKPAEVPQRMPSAGIAGFTANVAGASTK